MTTDAPEIRKGDLLAFPDFPHEGSLTGDCKLGICDGFTKQGLVKIIPHDGGPVTKVRRELVWVPEIEQ